MSLDTKLQEAAHSIRQARSHAEFTVTPPGTRSPLARGLRLAALAAVVTLAVVGIPALVGSTTDGPSGGATGIPETVPPVTADPAIPSGPPHLILDLPDTVITDAYNMFDNRTGARVGTHTTYLATLTDGPDGWTGREILLRVQQQGASFPLFDDLVDSAESSDTVEVDRRAVTVYLIPDEVIDEGFYDQGILQWEESPGYDAILIPWGIGPEEALQLLDGLEEVSDFEWEQLTSTEGSANTTTTSVAANVGLDRPYFLDAPGWTLVQADYGVDGSHASEVYAKPREGTQHPDRLVVGVHVDATVPADELAAAMAGGPEWDGRVDGFGNPWSEPAREELDVSGRSVTLVSFTDYQHMAYWVDETGAGVLVTADRATRDEMITLIGELNPVSWDSWLQTTDGIAE